MGKGTLLLEVTEFPHTMPNFIVIDCDILPTLTASGTTRRRFDGQNLLIADNFIGLGTYVVKKRDALEKHFKFI
jgi:hypothetical protein